MKENSLGKWLVILCSIVLLIGLNACSSCSQKKVTFDPNNEDQIVEIYVVTSYGGEKALKVIEKYNLKDPKVMEKYSMALAQRALTPESWQEFMKKVEAKKAEMGQ